MAPSLPILAVPAPGGTASILYKNKKKFCVYLNTILVADKNC